LFSGFLFYPGYFGRVAWAVVLFSGLSSSVYLFNDIIDAPQDRLHPFKKKRPIASGKLPVPIALFAAIILFFSVLYLGWILSFFFFLTCLAYLLLHVVYTVKFKKIPILDVLSIAGGFILRVYAGALVVNLHMNVWFLLTVVSLALFLAIGKRQSERTLIKGLEKEFKGQRATLSRYTQRLLDIYTGMFANATWFTYALFAFEQQFERTGGKIPTLFSVLPRTLTTQKWLMATVPIVVYGVMRYLQLVYEQNKGESPERVLLSDKPLLTAVIVWVVMVVGIIYGIG